MALELTRENIYKIIMAEMTIPPKDFNPNASIHTYNIDSLHIHEFSLLFSELMEVDVEFQKGIYEHLNTFKDIADYVLEHADVAE